MTCHQALNSYHHTTQRSSLSDINIAVVCCCHSNWEVPAGHRFQYHLLQPSFDWAAVERLVQPSMTQHHIHYYHITLELPQLHRATRKHCTLGTKWTPITTCKLKECKFICLLPYHLSTQKSSLPKFFPVMVCLDHKMWSSVFSLISLHATS